MRSWGKCTMFMSTLILCVFLASNVFAAEVSLNTLQLNGAAQITSTGSLRLVSANGSGGIVGSAFTNNTLDVGSFSTSFAFQISESGGLQGGADGFAFVLQTTGPTAIGSAGGWLGYQNYYAPPVTFQNSIAVEFDTYNNDNEPLISDTSGNHIGIDTNGSVHSLVTANVTNSLKDGSIWYSWIDYNGNTLEVRLNQTGTRPDLALLAFDIDVAALLGGNIAYAGFSSGEAAGVGNHDILSWDYSGGAAPVPEPSTMLLLGSGLAGLVGYGRRRFKKRSAHIV